MEKEFKLDKIEVYGGIVGKIPTHLYTLRPTRYSEYSKDKYGYEDKWDSKKEELLDCPFCGGEAADKTPWPYIECLKCGASAEPDVWNTRKSNQGLVELDDKFRIESTKIISNLWKELLNTNLVNENCLRRAIANMNKLISTFGTRAERDVPKVHIIYEEIIKHCRYVDSGDLSWEIKLAESINDLLKKG